MNNFCPYKILMMEYNKDIRTILREFFENLGCEVIEAGNNKDIVKLSLRESPDLIIISLNLAGADGLQAIYNIRRQYLLSAVPILANSTDGKFGMELFSNIEKFGCGRIEYITRPFKLSELTDRIEMLLPNIKKTTNF